MKYLLGSFFVLVNIVFVIGTDNKIPAAANTTIKPVNDTASTIKNSIINNVSNVTETTPSVTEVMKDLNVKKSNISVNATETTVTPAVTESVKNLKGEKSDILVNNVTETIPPITEIGRDTTTEPIPTKPTTSSTTTAQPTTTEPTTTTNASTSTTLKPPTVTPSPIPDSTTYKPTVPTNKPSPLPNNRKFDGPSFVGGIVLAFGLVAIGFVAFKFYKARTELNYHTL